MGPAALWFRGKQQTRKENSKKETMKTKSTYSRGNENKRLDANPPLYTLQTALENTG